MLHAAAELSCIATRAHCKYPKPLGLTAAYSNGWVLI